MSASEGQKTTVAIEKEKKKNSDRVHFFLSGALVAMSYIFWSDFSSFRLKAPGMGIEMRPLSDGYYIILVAITLQILRRIVDKCFRSRLEKRLLKENLLDLDLRREKLTRQIFDSMYYFSIYIYARIIARGVDFIPDCYGGDGTCDSMGMYWPRMKFSEKMRWYIIIQFGHHLHNLIYHTVAMKNVGNYFEMITHHYATVISLFYSYFTNWEDFALIILVSHDLSDGFLNFGKMLRDVGYGSTIWMSLDYVLLAFFWFYHRTVLIATCNFTKNYEYLWWKTPFPQDMDLWLSVRRGVNFIIFNLFLIWCMNIFWWVQILKMGVNKFIKKKKWVSQHEGEIDHEEVERRQQASKPSEAGRSTLFAVDPAPEAKKKTE
jgi:hypothetical protein